MSDELDQLTKARDVLVKERRNRAETIAKTGSAMTNDALDALIKVQQAIEAVDRAIEEIAYEDDELDDEE